MRRDLVVMLAFSGAALADCGQDFSGEWTREAVAGAASDEAYRAEGSGWSDRIRVSQDGGRVSIESFYFARTDMQPPLRFNYLPGQGATENVVMVGQGAQKQVSEARWNDCRLVISTRFSAADGASPGITVTQTLWLESGALVVETVRGTASANRTLYRRAAAAGGT